LKKIGHNLYFWPEIDKNLPKKWGSTELLMENALILCNPHDKNYLLRAEQVA